MPDWRITQLAPDQEQAFQRDMMFSPNVRAWQKSFVNRFGEKPDLNDNGYDYRGAWQAGMRPEANAQDEGFPHWGSTTPEGRELKAPDHPTRWKQTFVETYGTNPDENATPKDWAGAIQSGLVPAPGTLNAPPMQDDAREALMRALMNAAGSR